MFNCSFCDYFTDRKFNLQRHLRNKHKIDYFDYEEDLSNHINKMNKDSDSIKLSCKICNKIYKTEKHLINHEKKCNKVDNLTCPRCMISFSNRKHKSRHIKANKCKARSIIYARTPNVHNISNNFTFQNAKTIQNCVTTNNINNSIIINNFGSERIDHITSDDIKTMLLSGINTIPLYIQKKHFDNNFPENRNIMYTNDNKCKVMEDNCWKEKDLTWLSSNLVEDNCEMLLMYCDENEIMLLNEIQDSDKYQHIRNKLYIIYNKNDSEKYNQVLSKIRDLIKNS